MNFFNVLWLATLVCTLGACGMDADCSGNSQRYHDECQQGPETTEKSAESYFEIRGAIVGAFEVDVDGRSYSDIESFYTEEREQLNQRIEDAGYYDYEVEFDAELGFKDLTTGMSVFISSSERRGYAAKTTVSQDDTFSLRLPEDAAGDTYKIRAVKRVNLILSSLEETLVFCYNFSALDLSVPYDEVDKPVVLSSFRTSITSYECPEGSTGGFTVPDNGSEPLSDDDEEYGDDDTQDDESESD